MVSTTTGHRATGLLIDALDFVYLLQVSLTDTTAHSTALMAVSQVTDHLTKRRQFWLPTTYNLLTPLVAQWQDKKTDVAVLVLQRLFAILALIALVFISVAAASDRQPLFNDLSQTSSGHALPQRFQEMVQRR